MSEIAYAWARDPSIEQLLRDKPWQFDFYQAVRLLEAMARHIGPLAPVTDAKQPVRFESSVSFGFPASEVQEIDAASQPPRMVVNFMGLAGAHSPLPAPYTEMVLAAAARKDHAAAAFLDIFNNRLVWLLYRAREAHHPGLTARPPQDGRIAKYLFSTIGLGQETLRNRLAVPDRALLHYSGLLASPIRSAAGLERMLADYFDAPVVVQQFRGVWRYLDPAQLSRLGSRNQRLGTDAVLGTRAWDQGGGVSVTIGPLEWDRFAAFLPRHDASRELCELARFYLGKDYDVQIRLLLQVKDVPPSTLGKARLGHTSWLVSRPYGEKMAESVLGKARLGKTAWLVSRARAEKTAEVRFAAWFATEGN